MADKKKIEAEFLELVDSCNGIIRNISQFYSSFDEEMAEDLYQEIVYNLWKSYPKFIRKDNCKASTWLYRVSLNVAISQYRKGKNRIVPVAMDNIKTEIEETSETDLQEKLNELIAKLNEDEKAVLFLYLEDKSQKEIAEIIGCTETNVGTKIYRIKQKLVTFKNQSND